MALAFQAVGPPLFLSTAAQTRVRYALYQTIDYVYGLPAWDSKYGFTKAQATLNIFETALSVLLAPLTPRLTLLQELPLPVPLRQEVARQVGSPSAPH